MNCLKSGCDRTPVRTRLRNYRWSVLNVPQALVFTELCDSQAALQSIWPWLKRKTAPGLRPVTWAPPPPLPQLSLTASAHERNISLIRHLLSSWFPSPFPPLLDAHATFIHPCAQKIKNAHADAGPLKRQALFHPQEIFSFLSSDNSSPARPRMGR